MSTYSQRIDDTVNKGRAWKMPSCICSCQLCIKSDVCYDDCWKMRRLLEIVTGCQPGPQYDWKSSFYFNCYFFLYNSNKLRSQTESCLFSSTDCDQALNIYKKTIQTPNKLRTIEGGKQCSDWAWQLNDQLRGAPDEKNTHLLFTWDKNIVSWCLTHSLFLYFFCKT